MGFLSNIEHSVEHGLSSLGHHVVDECVSLEHDVVNTARVGEVMLEGAWDYTKTHPGQVATTLAIAAGVGIGSALATPFLPAIAVVGVCTTLGAIGTAALAVNTASSVKDCWSDVEIVWDADHHSKGEVAAAKKSVEAHTGEAVTNLALLPVTFYVGNAAGNASLAGAEAASSTGAALSTGCSVVTAAGESLPCPSIWTRIEANPVYNFLSSPYVAESDVKSLVGQLGRMLTSEATATRHAQ